MLMVGHYKVMPKKIVLDCDPGVDDALAIAYAVGSPELDLLGVTTVAGNVSLAKTTANAIRVLEFVGAGQVPVTAGSPVPLLPARGSILPTAPGRVARALTAESVHGEDGLLGAPLPPPATGPRPGHATDYIIETVLRSPGEITLVATGPLTNIALALRREPALAASVADFVIMGGSSSRGNVTPAAEFNIAVDPEAAAIVFAAGWTVTMVGLDVTLLARATRPVIARLRGLGRLARDLVLPCLRSHADGDTVVTLPGPEPDSADPAVHDVCAVAHVAYPGLLSCQPASVQIETAGNWTTGMTVCDFRAAASGTNAAVATSIDADGFWDSVVTAYTRLPPAS
jgi:purine nucleosidase